VKKEIKDYFSKEKFLIPNLMLRDNWIQITVNSVKALARSCQPLPALAGSVQHIITLLAVSATERRRE